MTEPTHTLDRIIQEVARIARIPREGLAGRLRQPQRDRLAGAVPTALEQLSALEILDALRTLFNSPGLAGNLAGLEAELKRLVAPALLQNLPQISAGLSAASQERSLRWELEQAFVIRAQDNLGLLSLRMRTLLEHAYLSAEHFELDQRRSEAIQAALTRLLWYWLVSNDFSLKWPEEWTGRFGAGGHYIQPEFKARFVRFIAQTHPALLSQLPVHLLSAMSRYRLYPFLEPIPSDTADQEPWQQLESDARQGTNELLWLYHLWWVSLPEKDRPSARPT